MAEQMINQFDKIDATFNPRRTDDLQNDAEQYIGQGGVFQAMWKIEDGEYEGEWAMMPPVGWGFAWVPSCDLVI